jgi:SAM-dependent methyltransferase
VEDARQPKRVYDVPTASGIEEDTMTLFYRVAYRVGFTPWEDGAVQGPAAEQISGLFDREEIGRQPPYGPALDLGCGAGIWSIKLAARGWQVTGVDIVPEALRRARERAQRADVQVRFVEGDVTGLRAADVGSGFRFLLDFECFNGLNDAQREAMGREVSAVADDDATLLMLTWAPGRRWPLARGASREDIEAAFLGWSVIDEDVYEKSALPRPLKNVDPRFYRLHRD